MAVTVGVPLVSDHFAIARHLDERVHAALAAQTPHCTQPHLSLLVLLDDPEIERVDELLVRVARRVAPFPVRARGYGAFVDAGRLVLYVPVVRTAALAALHDVAFHAAKRAGLHVDGHYSAESWIPHVTLCELPLRQSEVARLLATDDTLPPISWKLTVDRLARVGVDDADAFVLGARKP
jgi:2'-5' RNA ligase